MVCGRRTMILTAMLFAGLGYWLYTPVSDDIDDPWLLRIMNAFLISSDALARLMEAVGYDSYSSTTRAAFEIFFGASVTGSDEKIEVTDTNFDGVPVRIYKPKGLTRKSLPGVVFYHGGGWVLLSVDSYDAMTKALALDTGAVVVSVEYRLAPEHPFPIPFDDCFSATLHFMNNAAKFGVDPSRIAVVGDSSGGNLAAAVSHKMSNDPSLPKPRVQALVYPVLQLCDFRHPSLLYINKFGATGLTLQHVMLYYLNASMKYLPMVSANQHLPVEWRTICSEVFNIDLIPKELLPEGYKAVKKSVTSSAPHLPNDVVELIFNPLVSPLMAKDLSNLPPTLVVTAGFDRLLDHGIIYSKRLQLAGVEVQWRNFPACFHGSINFFGDKSKRCSEMYSSIVKYLNDNLI